MDNNSPDPKWPFPPAPKKSAADFIRETQERRATQQRKEAYDRAKRAVEENR